MNGSELWSYFSVRAQCLKCKLEISLHSGSFSLLFSHLTIDHNINLKEVTEEQHKNDDALKDAFKEEEGEEDPSNYDPYDEEEEVKPIVGIQILKVKEEDKIDELEEEIKFNDDNENYGNSDNENFEKKKKRWRKYVRKDPSGVAFDKFEHFDQSDDNECDAVMICKYCKEKFPNNVLVLTKQNQLSKLKRHLITLHKEELEPSLAESIINQIETERIRKHKAWKNRSQETINKRAEYRRRNAERFKMKRLEQSWSIDPETGKEVNLRTIRMNKKREFFKCPYEGCPRDAVSEWALQAHIRSIHTREKPYICNNVVKDLL